MARATKIGICNKALTQIGADRIVDIGTPNDSELAQKLNAVYDYDLQEVLGIHPWKFATKRTTLALLSETPTFGYTYAFRLPTDYIRAITPDPNTIDYRIEDNKVLYNENTFSLKYISYVDDPSKFSVGFIRAFASKLAASIAYAVTNSKEVSALAIASYREELQIAKGMDSQEGGTPDSVVEEDPAEVRG